MCAPCLANYAIFMLEAGSSQPDGKGFQKFAMHAECREFCVDAMRILTTLATPAGKETIAPDLWRTLTACSIHRPRPRNGADLDQVACLVYALATMLCICLSNAFKTSSVLSVPKFSTKGAWPTSVADILPGQSPHLSLVGLLNCWTSYDDSGMHSLLASVLRLPIYSVITAALVEVRANFLPMFCARLSAQGQLLATMDLDHGDLVPMQEQLAALLDLGTALRYAFPLAKASSHQFVIDHQSELSAALDDAQRGAVRCHPSSLAVINDIRMGFIGFNHAPDADTFRSMLTTLKHSPDLRPDADAYTRFYGLASTCSKQSKCGARLCQGYGHVEGAKLLRCGRCMTFRYCSQQCQRAHWKDEKRPHSAVCATLARVKDVAPFYTGGTDKHAFSAACRRAGITVEELVLPFFHFLSIYTLREHSVEDGVERKLPVFNE